MPWFDTLTGKIEGARPGTKAYAHEYRHKMQGEWGLLKIEATFAFFFPGVAMAMLWLFPPVPVVIDLAKWSVTLYFLYIIGLELDAWIYAFTHEESNYSGGF